MYTRSVLRHTIPQTDGFNQTLKSMLKKTAIEQGKDWDKLLPYPLFAYQEVPQSSTGLSHFEIVFGRPMDVLRELGSQKEEQ